MKITTLDLLKYMKELSFLNFETANSGNISIRLDNGFIAIKPSGMNYSKIHKNQISIVSLNGKKISGLNPSSDLQMHIDIYINRPEINCVIHTHSHYATVMSMLNKSLKIITTMQADHFGKEIFCMPYLNHRKENIGKKFTKTKENVVLLERHGALLVDKDPRKALVKMIALEEIARINFHSLFLPKKIKSLKSKDVDSLNTYYSKKYGQKLSK